LIKNCNQGRTDSYCCAFKSQWKFILDKISLTDNAELRKNVLIKKYTSEYLSKLNNDDIFLLYPPKEKQRIINDLKKVLV
jgi:viroplasmin and RNaseH domain-containing protein